MKFKEEKFEQTLFGISELLTIMLKSLTIMQCEYVRISY